MSKASKCIPVKCGICGNGLYSGGPKFEKNNAVEVPLLDAYKVEPPFCTLVLHRMQLGPFVFFRPCPSNILILLLAVIQPGKTYKAVASFKKQRYQVFSLIGILILLCIFYQTHWRFHFESYDIVTDVQIHLLLTPISTILCND